MRNFILLMVLSFVTFSCDAPAKQEAEMERAPGFLRAGGEQINATDASPENLDIWDKYIDAHNNRDLEIIASMNIDSTQMGEFRILAPNGQVIRGSDTQIEFLKGWFEAETGRIDADMKRIEAEKKVQSSLASKKFLGMF